MRMLRIKNLIVPILLFGVVFGLYLYTSPRLPTGYADSEEMMAAAYTLGVPHPPGSLSFQFWLNHLLLFLLALSPLDLVFSLLFLEP